MGVMQMVRIQLRRDTAANWTSSNPVLRAGEVGIETDTLKFKIGNGTSTWTQITGYANVTPSSLTSSLSEYIESGDLGQPSGPAQLTAGGDLLVPENEIVMWSAETNTYTTTLTATEPTADRTITFKDGSGTLAFTTDVPSNTDSLSEGTTNKYFTDERAQDAIGTALAAGTHSNITVSYDDSANSISLSASGAVASLSGTSNEVEVTNVGTAYTIGLPNDVTISNNLTVTGDISAADSIQLTTTAAEASATGKLVWDDGEGVPAIGLKGGNVDLKVGTQEVALCYNGTGSSIPKGSVVYISGAQGQKPSIALSDADAEMSSSKTFGLAAEEIAVGTEGFVTTFGIVNGLNTSSFTAGQALWLSGTAGGLTATKPSAPTHMVFVGYCLHSNSTSGRIFVNPQNGYEIEELHNVQISSVANNDVLKYDSTSSTWKNTNTLNLNSLTVTDLTVSGTTTTVNSTDLEVSDPLIYIGTGNTANANDLGIVGHFDNGTYQHTGIVRDATDGVWKFFSGVTTEPGTTVDFTNATYDTLKAGAFQGNLTGNVTGNLTGNVTGDVSGNAGTVTNGVYTTGTYDNPSWITGLGWSKISSTPTTLSGYGITDALASATAASTYAPIASPTFTGSLDVNGTTSYELNSNYSSSSGYVQIDNTGIYLNTASDDNLDYANISVEQGILTLGTNYGDMYFDNLGLQISSNGTNSANRLVVIGDTVNPLTVTGTTSTFLGTADFSSATVTGIDALPSQSGNTGKYLTTDGSSASWATLSVPITTGTVTVNQNTAQDVDTTALSAFTSIEYMISIKQGSKVRTSKVIMQTDGTSVDMTEFAITETGGTIAGVVVSATTASSNGKLQVTVTDALSTNATVKLSKVAL